MKVITTEAIPIKLWAETVEEGALQQARNLARLPFAFRHVALMPDVHEGYGMPIGGVLATRDVIIPNAVGVDIGCGMCAQKTDLREIEPKILKQILGGIRKSIPLGFKRHKEKQDAALMPIPEDIPRNGIVDREYDHAREQIGTLGGGNHFIEIQRGRDGYIWLMVHSGSRNLGHQVAEHYNKLAKQLNEKWHTGIDRSANLAFLPLATEEARAYLQEMQYCVDFAFSNRKLMMGRILEVLHDHTGSGCGEQQFINIAHNYAAMENHFRQNVLVHRKGATRAQEGELGIIPGSQGTKSYIVRGRGNTESFQSCSHGAGRVMGRKQAQRELDLESEKERLDKQGIIHSIRSVDDLDEAPSAYKNIQDVMDQQADLVHIVEELSPLAVVKG
ncbi:MAG: RtcB family protein [Bacteroidales bacterium]|nr:RtcB family protein [Bacteroidales bacterium]